MVKALAVDLSSNNARPNLRAHYAAGYRVLILKATEGLGYTWTDAAALHREWHSLGKHADDVSVWRYHFGQRGSGVAQADRFVAAVRELMGPADRPVVDCEVAGVNGVLVRAFAGRVEAKLKAVKHDRGLIYGGPYFLRDAKIVSVHGWGLWIADYAARIALVPPGFGGKVAAWQYTDRKTGVPGIPGAVDHSTIDPAWMPKAHREKRLATPFAHRHDARLLLHALKARSLPVEAGHGDRHLLRELEHEIHVALERKAHA